MARYGAKIVDEPEPQPQVERVAEVRSRYSQLFAKPFTGLTTAIAIFAIGVGIVSFGFQLWIPSNLQTLGFDDVTSTRILRDAAIIGFPLNFLVAWAYGAWSSKGTMIALAGLTAFSLIWFAFVGDGVAGNRALLYVLLVVPIWGISSITAVLSAYSSEVYPTRIRSRGSGLAAGASKAAGVAMIGLVVLAVTSPSITVTTLLGGVPMAVAAVAIAAFGIETRRRRLEEITAEEFGVEVVSQP
jgi:putative MFS transporter